MIHAKFTERLKRRMNEIYMEHTGNDYETIEAALERDNFMTAEESQEFGLIDRVITSREAIETGS